MLITGAAGGLGTATTQRFRSEGWTVFAADLNPPPSAAGVVPVQMDVTDTESVDAALTQVEAQSAAGLSCVVSLAGILGVGPMAEMADDRLQRIVDVNIMGTHRAVRAAFPLLRAGGGRIILISSETGWQRAMPFNGAYALTKHAIEAYGDALRRELACIDVPVSIVQPGPFRTGMTASIEGEFARAVSPDSPFAVMAGRAGAMAAKEHDKTSDPSILAEAIVAAATSRRPRIRYSVRPNRSRSLIDMLPVRVVDAVLRRALG
ncbi:SDR family NAD(P)-dependent oxidoreductase [Prescottella agglutinans]|uniref:SDR family NAD(P)-dependent oxidoreductase n=1 Tax=Prescottella agglutinans TaxID=1644129 RepID=UPI0024739A40|nr:SDR family NAD(P)-dependent oxidoreductase [Prescottella agglutinans]